MCNDGDEEHSKTDSKNERHEHMKRRVAEAIVLSLYFLVDGMEIWSAFHVWALAVAAVGTSGG